MMRNKRTYRMLIFWSIGIVLTQVATAQQVGRYSMYMQNFYAVNPAAAGLEDHLDVTIGYRKQWLGFQNGPQNYFVSANMPLNKEAPTPMRSSIRVSNPEAYRQELPDPRNSKSGAGVMVNVHQYGAFRITQVYGTYAFHLPITKKLNISFGANAGLNAYTIDQSLISLEIPDDSYYDAAIADAQANRSLLDIDVGLMLYSSRFFVGYSSEQLLGNNVSFGSGTNFGDLLVHHRLLFGRKFRINRSYTVIPNGFLYMTRTGLLSAEINTRVDYRDQVWGGLSYRHKDAIVPMVGLYINDQLKIGYAYDINISAIRQYVGAGSHEFMLGFMFGNKRLVF